MDDVAASGIDHRGAPYEALTRRGKLDVVVGAHVGIIGDPVGTGS
jgi:hypothetical protein